MRVIGGTAKGHRLRTLRGQRLRPTADRVKESLFNILPRDLSGLRVLDLFAGSGSLSAEALSRGAGEAVLIDHSPRAGKAIESNLRALGFSRRSRIKVFPVPRAIRYLSSRNEKFDLVFVDPPYEKGWVQRILKLIGDGGLLQNSGTLVVEHSGKEQVQEGCGPLRLRDQRRYGGTCLSFYGMGSPSQ
ncbi:MAG: 16S rRNA (guanine(966)-N(2))-methyltransferase RsmD [Candidatus Binatia bacterium]|jgi:16S rRNA (guanine(966)-N(2))-methyltransferase RsmD|nr:16S rRNA (guanine(966)-N(2))-methyltransferase RsmD [Candidatus Binatia bacterium]